MLLVAAEIEWLSYDINKERPMIAQILRCLLSALQQITTRHPAVFSVSAHPAADHAQPHSW
jgi:hypothetical protein